MLLITSSDLTCVKGLPCFKHTMYCFRLVRAVLIILFKVHINIASKAND